MTADTTGELVAHLARILDPVAFDDRTEPRTLGQLRHQVSGAWAGDSVGVAITTALDARTTPLRPRLVTAPGGAGDGRDVKPLSLAPLVLALLLVGCSASPEDAYIEAVEARWDAAIEGLDRGQIEMTALGWDRDRLLRVGWAACQGATADRMPSLDSAQQSATPDFYADYVIPPALQELCPG